MRQLYDTSKESKSGTSDGNNNKKRRIHRKKVPPLYNMLAENRNYKNDGG